MKFVALVSGGKDSCFNILHCLAQGHELVCLANLYPPQEGNDEMDSYMYQTVGHDVLTLYEKCIGKPMYREPILGGASNQKLEYHKTENDETEDLYRLLSKVLKSHPDVEAVSVGAILSSYQRTRVEDVCSRLGLTSLAYLWQRDQGELMNEMCNSSMDARIIKVAAIGLNDSNLGMSLQEIHPTLLRLNQMFGVHICGEGGEFETSVLDAPFFKYGRIKILNKTVIKHTNDDVWYLKMEVGFEPKLIDDSKINDWSSLITQPPLLNEKFQEIYDNIQFDKDKFNKEVGSEVISNGSHVWQQNIFEYGDKIYASSLSSDKPTVEEQIVDIFDQLKIILLKFDVDFEHIQSSKLLIKDMANFANVNKIYVKYFTKPLPPSRICVETNLPGSMQAQLSVVISKNIDVKSGLHVQGRSYWAPCNIGPYSQAIANNNDKVMRISGQIPLIPKNMELFCKDHVLSSVLALQHYDSIKKVTGYNNNLITICFVKVQGMVELVSNVFKEYISINEDYDNGNNNLVIVQVTELPRCADSEWGGVVYQEDNGLNYGSDSDSDEDDDNDVVVEKKNSVSIHYVNKLEEFPFSNQKPAFYEIYANPSSLEKNQLSYLDSSNVCGYEIFPVVNVFKSYQNNRDGNDNDDNNNNNNNTNSKLIAIVQTLV